MRMDGALVLVLLLFCCFNHGSPPARQHHLHEKHIDLE